MQVLDSEYWYWILDIQCKTVVAHWQPSTPLKLVTPKPWKGGSNADSLKRSTIATFRGDEKARKKKCPSASLYGERIIQVNHLSFKLKVGKNGAN